MRFVYPDWITADLPGIGGTFKACAEDFLVEEIPSYDPSGQGDFLYLWIEKKDVAAREFQEILGRAFQIGQQEIGIAGLKDRTAVTRQWVSLPKNREPLLSAFDHPAVKILNTNYHSNKLKTGHLKGNRFRIRIRGTGEKARDQLPRLLQRIEEKGIPNAYDLQRFGRNNETWKTGWELLKGPSSRFVKPWLRRLALSALQSGIFNAYLVDRMADGLLHQVIPGEVLGKSPAGGLFNAPVEESELPREQERLNHKEIVGAGPIFGWKLLPCKGPALEREQKLLESYSLKRDDFLSQRKLMEGTRRRNIIYPRIEVLGWEGSDVELGFELPSGSYATRVIGELMHTEFPEKETEANTDCSDGEEFPDA